MDWDSLWGQAKEQVSKGWEQVQQVGVPVIKATVEAEALKLLNAQHAETTATVKEQVGALVNSGAGESTLGNILKDAATPAFVEKYKTELIFGVVGILLIGVFVAKGMK